MRAGLPVTHPHGLCCCTSPALGVLLCPYGVLLCPAGSAVLSIASLPASTSVYKWFNYSIPLLPLANATCLGSPCNMAYLSTGSVSVIPAYGQCGGAGGECSKFYCNDAQFPGVSCTNGWSCVRQHRWYYQCLPGGTNSTTTSTGSSTSITTVVNSTAIPAYGQCGGAGGLCTKFSACADAAFRGYTCANGYNCQRQQLYFWQCVPGGATTTTAPASNTTGSSLLPYAQCGGTGGICSVYSSCSDTAFPGYGCGNGWVCQRQVRDFMGSIWVVRWGY